MKNLLGKETNVDNLEIFPSHNYTMEAILKELGHKHFINTRQKILE